MLKQAMLSAALLAAFGAPNAHARLQISITANGATFTCFDGQGCDLASTPDSVLVLDPALNGAFVEVALAQSSFGKTNELQLSSGNIVNNSAAPINIKFFASDTGFSPPVEAIRESASLTFNNAVGSPASTLQFFADPANAQGANPTNTPGVLLDTVTGTPASNPDSFAGTHTTAFKALAPFSMTESASLNLIAGGSITGFNQSMQSVTAIPEASTWAMLALGFAGLGFAARSKARTTRHTLNA